MLPSTTSILILIYQTISRKVWNAILQNEMSLVIYVEVEMAVIKGKKLFEHISVELGNLLMDFLFSFFFLIGWKEVCFYISFFFLCPKKNLMWPCINITPQVVIYVTKNQQRYMMAAAKEIRSYTLHGVRNYLMPQTLQNEKKKK